MTTIPKGSVVLVTGANGFIGSHVADQLLRLGYKVRGTVRSEAKGQWLLDRFNKQYGAGNFTLALIPDISMPGAMASAIVGASAIIHIASDTTIANTDPNETITPLIRVLESILEAADNEPSIKRVVYTSSVVTTFPFDEQEEVDIDENSWNNEAVTRAWAPPPYEGGRLLDTYIASKVQTEQAFWKFVKEKKPHFTVNTVLPGGNFGPSLHPQNQQSSTGTTIPDLYQTGEGMIQYMLSHVDHIDVRDAAQLHVASLIDESIVNERIFAAAHSTNASRIVEIVRKLRPDHDQKGHFPDRPVALYRLVRKARAEEMLQKHFGHGFISLEESIEASIAHLG